MHCSRGQHLLSNTHSPLATTFRAKAVFARREPHADILSSVVGNHADLGAVTLPDMLSVVWVPDVVTVTQASFSSASVQIVGLKNFEWLHHALTGGVSRGVYCGDGGGNFPFSFRKTEGIIGAGEGADYAHMYYTSGTTGNPKGVMLTHDIVGKHAVATCAEMRIDRGDVWAHVVR